MQIPDISSMPISSILSLTGRVAVVTGGAMGLGKATARRLTEVGASVVIADIDLDSAHATVKELKESNARVAATRMDVLDSRSVSAAADFAVDKFGGLDIWVNNAGIPSAASLTAVSEDEWDRVMGVNLRGTFLGAREASKRMITADKNGVIINIASLAGMCGIATQTTYGSSKAGVIGLTLNMSVDLAPHGIRVLAIAPGVMLTENKMHIANMEPEVARNTGIPGLAGSALGRLGVADDIARVVLFCASDLSIFMTGTTLVVDGGVRA